jgi:hypothetical protein
MSTLRPNAVERYATSAFPLKADIRSPFNHVRFMPKADSCTAAKSALFDHLVGGDEQRRWHIETECFRSPEVDTKLEFCG